MINLKTPQPAPTVKIASGTDLFRVHQAAFGPLFFGPAAGDPPAYRFDAPAGEYRTLYAAQSLSGAYVETVLRQPGRILRRAFVDERGWSNLTTKFDMKMVRLHGEALQAFGVDAHDLSDALYSQCQALAGKLHQAYPDHHGITYRSKYNNDEFCYAIFDRIGDDAFDVSDFQAFKDNDDIVDGLMKSYGAIFDTSLPIPPLSKIKP